MRARLVVTLEGEDAPVLASAIEPDIVTALPGAAIARSQPEVFVVTGEEPAAFRAAANTLLRLVATGASVASAAPRPGEGHR